ncbi:MAG: hypothetical protein AB7S68_39145 [Polyangiaceae bacterium]
MLVDSVSPLSSATSVAEDAVFEVMSLEQLESFSPALLLRLLRPYARSLEGHGVPTTDIATDERWFGQLYRCLNSEDPALPVDLRQALMAVGDLVNDHSSDSVVSLVRSRGVHPDWITPQDLALLAYLDHRDLFEAAHVRSRPTDARRFVEFVGKNSRGPSVAALEHGRRPLAERLGRWFSERNRTAFCDVRILETEREVRFLIIHGRPMRNQGAIETDEQRGRVIYVPDKHDLIVFDRNTGRLAVNAQFAREQNLYRDAIGEAFWGDAEHFRAAPVFSGQPLLDLGSAAVDTYGVPGVERVVLRELTVVSRATLGQAITWTGPDLSAQLDGGLGLLVRQQGVVTAFRLDLTITVRKRPMRLDIRVPNHWCFDRRVNADLVREYLLEAGFMSLPEADLALTA